MEPPSGDATTLGGALSLYARILRYQSARREEDPPVPPFPLTDEQMETFLEA
jgi:hypothetical protein